MRQYVAESRRWKETVARQIRGQFDGIQHGQVPTFFSKGRAFATLAEMRHSSELASYLREESWDE